MVNIDNLTLDIGKKIVWIRVVKLGITQNSVQFGIFITLIFRGTRNKYENINAISHIIGHQILIIYLTIVLEMFYGKRLDREEWHKFQPTNIGIISYWFL